MIEVPFLSSMWITRPIPLSRDSKPMTIVSWSTLGGSRRVGLLMEWDNGTAIIFDLDREREVAVRA
jgi:hypothetical protein